MNTTSDIHDEQKKLWNGLAGQAWVDAQVLLDQMFKPFEDRLVAAVGLKRRSNVLDIGCGTGSTTLAIARQLNTTANCTGIDISEPMIAAARARTPQTGASTHFIVADAQTHAFEPGKFDTIISRFGIMFFNDPVAAFANLNRAAKKTADLHCIAWRSPEENPFMTTAERAAAPLLQNLPARKPGAAGQFAFADRHHVYRILDDSGWNNIELQALDITCTFPENQLIRYITRLGPIGLILQSAEEKTRQQIIEVVRKAFAPYVHGTEVRFNTACWMVNAKS